MTEAEAKEAQLREAEENKYLSCEEREALRDYRKARAGATADWRPCSKFEALAVRAADLLFSRLLQERKYDCQERASRMHEIANLKSQIGRMFGPWVPVNEQDLTLGWQYLVNAVHKESGLVMVLRAALLKTGHGESTQWFELFNQVGGSTIGESLDRHWTITHVMLLPAPVAQPGPIKDDANA